MSNGYATDDLEAILESLEFDESDEADERVVRRRTFRPPTTAPGRGLAPPRPQPGYVTEARLQAALARVGEQIKTNSDAIKAVNGRINTISSDVSRQATSLKKEIEERKKDNNALRSAVQFAALLPLLTRPPSKEIKESTVTDAIGLAKGDKVLVDKADTLSSILPVLLLSGLGTPTSSDGTSSGGGGGFNDPTALLVLTLALTQKP